MPERFFECIVRVDAYLSGGSNFGPQLLFTVSVLAVAVQTVSEPPHYVPTPKHFLLDGYKVNWHLN